MEESKIRETEQRFESIVQTNWFSAIFKWPLIKSEVLQIKLNYSQISRELMYYEGRINTLDNLYNEMKQELSTIKEELKHTQSNLDEIQSKHDSDDLQHKKSEVEGKVKFYS
ncbi:MAG: hypothetical protein ACLFPL_05575 [Candidatus Nanoarchaeia archaeon]